MFALVRIHLRNHVDTQPVRRFKCCMGYAVQGLCGAGVMRCRGYAVQGFAVSTYAINFGMFQVSRECEFIAQVVWWCCAFAHLKENIGLNIFH